jgi:hypothetical protein
MAMTQEEMNKNIIFANQGDKITLRSGEVVEFIKCNRTKFVFSREGIHYNTSIENFVEIVEKAEPKKINQSYKKLREGELFYISHKDSAIVFTFIEIKNGKIVGKNPINNGLTTIDINLYGGKISELINY